ncbi:unnamed protein product [Jaminaea pallidilutea]
MSNAGPLAQEQSSVAQRLPFELLVAILSRVLLAPPSFPGEEEVPIRHVYTQTWRLLGLSKSLRSALEPVFYSRVSLTSTRSLDLFAQTLKARSDLNRKVKSMWIAPNSLHSDFLTALKPPADGIHALPQSGNLTATIRAILRACRSLQHLALDGCLCTLKASTLFGSNCQPISVMSINPYSFLGGFSAPMFRKVRRLELCDTSLASGEVEHVRTLPDLCHFVWTSPRDWSEPRRDIVALLRIVAPPPIRPSHLHLAVSGDVAEAENDSHPQSMLPVKPQPPRNLRSVTIRTGQGRSAELGTHLRIAVEEQTAHFHQHGAGFGTTTNASAAGGGEGGEDDHDDQLSAFAALSISAAEPSIKRKPYIDSSAHTTRVEHPLTGVVLQTKKFAKPDEVIVDEWEALRDLICGSGDVGLEEARRASLRHSKTEEAKAKTRAATKDSTRDSNVQQRRGQEPVVDETEQEGSEAHEGEEELQPGRALQRLWAEWCRRVEDGSLEVPLGARPSYQD